MIVLTVILTAYSAFLTGYMLGKSEFTLKKEKGGYAVRKNTAMPISDEEYKNFLNYDGSEQI